MPVLPEPRRCRDEDGLIVARGDAVYAVLNLYPYNAGHLLVVPYRHVADYTDLTETRPPSSPTFTQRAMPRVRAASGAHGFNVGHEPGRRSAGAGIAAHLHQHVVPRWGGDTNFMPVVGHTKVLPQLLGDTRATARRRLAAELTRGRLRHQASGGHVDDQPVRPGQRERPEAGLALLPDPVRQRGLELAGPGDLAQRREAGGERAPDRRPVRPVGAVHDDQQVGRAEQRHRPPAAVRRDLGTYRTSHPPIGPLARNTTRS